MSFGFKIGSPDALPGQEGMPCGVQGQVVFTYVSSPAAESRRRSDILFPPCGPKHLPDFFCPDSFWPAAARRP